MTSDLIRRHTNFMVRQGRPVAGQSPVSAGRRGQNPSQNPAGSRREGLRPEARSEEEAVFKGHSDDERRSIRPQDPRPSGLPAGPGRLRRCSSSPCLMDTVSSSRLASAPAAPATRPCGVLGWVLVQWARNRQPNRPSLYTVSVISILSPDYQITQITAELPSSTAYSLFET